MKRILLIALLLVAWAPATALADYDARKSEAMSQLEKAEMSGEERAAVKKALETYFGGREDCFEGLIAVVAKTDESPQHATFRDRVGVCAVGATQVLSRALSDLKEPGKGALDFVNIFSGAEAAFYENLRAVLVAEARDLIVVIRLNLADMTEALEEKWERILGDDKSLDERAQRIAQEIRRDYADAIREAAEAHQDTAEVLAEGVKKLAESELLDIPPTGYPTVDTIVAGVKATTGPLITYWQQNNLRSGARTNDYKAIFASELRILVMFEDVRDDVKEFLEKNDWPYAEAAHAKAKSSLDTFVSNAKTSGQSRDASDLRDGLMVQLAAHLKQGSDVYATFVSKNKGRFVGALGPDIEEALVEHAEWERTASQLGEYGLDAKLREWHLHGTNYFGVDLDKLTSKTREQLKEKLRVVIEQLLKELKAAEAAHKAIESLIEDEREDVADALN